MSHRPLRIAMIHLSRFALDSRVQRQARALAERGDEVHLICLGERESLRVGAGAIHIHPVRARKPIGGAATYLREYANFTARALARVAALDLRHRFDIVQPHNMPDMVVAAALLPRLRGTPMVLDVHDTFPELYETKFPGPLHRMVARAVGLEERVCAAASSHLIVVTEQARERLQSRGVGVGKTSIVMNSPDERVFGPPRAPVPWPVQGPLRILYHGGLAPRFGVETLIRAVALLGAGVPGPEGAAAGTALGGPHSAEAPQVQLRVCGWGEDRDRLAALAQELAPGRIEIPREPVPFAHIPEELEKAHIGVVPPLHDAFTELLLPVKLLEYVHMGLPVVASRLPCMCDYFSDGEELRMFTPGDPHDLAAVLRELSLDPAGARQRAARATRRLPALAWEHQSAHYLALIDELAAGPARRRPRPVRLSTPH
jgi:glycosyltransferase involved in cell wall biosynthesis